MNDNKDNDDLEMRLEAWYASLPGRLEMCSAYVTGATGRPPVPDAFRKAMDYLRETRHHLPRRVDRIGNDCDFGIEYGKNCADFAEECERLAQGANDDDYVILLTWADDADGLAYGFVPPAIAAGLQVEILTRMARVVEALRGEDGREAAADLRKDAIADIFAQGSLRGVEPRHLVEILAELAADYARRLGEDQWIVRNFEDLAMTIRAY